MPEVRIISQLIGQLNQLGSENRYATKWGRRTHNKIDKIDRFKVENLKVKTTFKELYNTPGVKPKKLRNFRVLKS